MDLQLMNSYSTNNWFLWQNRILMIFKVSISNRLNRLIYWMKWGSERDDFKQKVYLTSKLSSNNCTLNRSIRTQEASVFKDFCSVMCYLQIKMMKFQLFLLRWIAFQSEFDLNIIVLVNLTNKLERFNWFRKQSIQWDRKG